KSIRLNTDKRCERILREQEKMLSSLLDKSFNQISIDRLIVERESSKALINNASEVLEKANKHFLNQFKRKEIRKDIMTKKWAKINRPIESIKDNWYSSMN